MTNESTTETEKREDVAPPKRVHIPWPTIFIGVALLSAVYGALVSTKTLARLDKALGEAKESSRPASVQLTRISAPGCEGCFNLDDAVATLKQQNVLVAEERTLLVDSPEVLALTEKLGITRVPTYVLTGEIGKKALENFIRDNGEVKNDTFVFTKVPPPFVDPNTGEEQGRVRVTYLTDPACFQCVDVTLIVEAYKKAGVSIIDEQTVAWNSSEGQRIIAQYALEKIPSFLLSSDIALYESVKSAWQGIGTVEKDGTYVARQIPLPYRDVPNGRIVGLIDVVYLVDASCAECYQPQTVQKGILTRGFGIGIRSERTIDISTATGKAMVAQYAITQVPTMLLSPDVGEYVRIKAVWPQVGTVEKDGWYVFRESSQLGDIIYKDLSSNQIIRPPQQAPPPTN